ncbi:hypothetical protein Tco_0565895 [Tanacetum coccineum]
MVAFLEKSTGSAEFHQIIDFITRSHICYALTKKPKVCVSFIKQFWRSAEALTDGNGDVKINATIDGHSLSITEDSLRRHLKLDDQDGITSLPTTKIFAQLALMGYTTDSDKLTFQKGAFSPQWFSFHNILHFIAQTKLLGAFSSILQLLGQDLLNFHYVMYDTEPSPSPSKITSSPSPTPSPSPEPSPTQPSPTQPSPTQPSPSQFSPTQPGIEYHLLTPHNSPLHDADLLRDKENYRSLKPKLILRVKKLESQIKIGKAKKQTRVVISDDEAFGDDSSKQGRKFSDEEVQEKASADFSDEEVQEKESADTELFIQEVTPTEVIQDQGQWESKLIFEKIWDFNQNIKPMDAKQGSKKQKSPEKERSTEKIVEEESETQEELKEGVKEPAAKRKKSIPRKTTKDDKS